MDGDYVSPIAELTLCLTIGNDANSPLRHFGHVSERFIPVSPGSAVFSEPTYLIFLSSREVNILVVLLATRTSGSDARVARQQFI